MEDGLQKEYKMITNKIYAVIPARFGSKGVINKNIQILNGKPLLAYSIIAAKAVPEIDRIIVSTDSTLYKEIAEKYGAEVPFLRPKAISGDDSRDIDWVNHLLHWLEKKEEQLPKYLIHLRPDIPLRKSKHISQAIRCIKKHPEATALRSVVEMEQSCYKDFEIENGFLKIVGSGSFNLDDANHPRQSYPITYNGKGVVDVLRTSHILETGKIHGNKVLAFLVPQTIDVDTMEDMEYLRYKVEKND